MVVKDEGGKVHVEKHEKPTQRGAWGGIFVGTLVGVLLPVVGVVALGGAAAAGGLVGGLGGHFLEGMSRGEAKELGEILETGQAALIVIGEIPREGGARQGADTRDAVGRDRRRCRPHTAQARAEEAEGRLGAEA